MRSRLREMKMEVVKRAREGDEGEGVIAPMETLDTPHHDNCIQDNSHHGSNRRRSTMSRQSEMDGEEIIEETTVPSTPRHDNGRRSSSSRKSTGKGIRRNRRAQP